VDARGDGGPSLLTVGLTGGIAAGKSTVAGFLAEAGAVVIDADRLAHAAIAPGGGAYDEVVERFGRGVLGDDEWIDRAKLGALVFADAEARADLERIVHPHVMAGLRAHVEELRERGVDGVVVFDAALIVEAGAQDELDGLIVVRCSQETQIERLARRSGLSREEALARIEAQVPLQDKLAVADWIIDTETALEETRRQTRRLYRELSRGRGT
jgi:dephospho-CoA kinase